MTSAGKNHGRVSRAEALEVGGGAPGTEPGAGRRHPPHSLCGSPSISSRHLALKIMAKLFYHVTLRPFLLKSSDICHRGT